MAETRQPRYVEFLTVCVVCDGEAIFANQNMIADILADNIQVLPVVDLGEDNAVYLSDLLSGVSCRCDKFGSWTEPPRTSTTRFLTRSSIHSESAVSQQEVLLTYYIKVLGLYRALTMGRNMKGALLLLANARTLGCSYSALLRLVQNGKLPFKLRRYAANLLNTLYMTPEMSEDKSRTQDLQMHPGKSAPHWHIWSAVAHLAQPAEKEAQSNVVTEASIFQRFPNVAPTPFFSDLWTYLLKYISDAKLEASKGEKNKLTVAMLNLLSVMLQLGIFKPDPIANIAPGADSASSGISNRGSVVLSFPPLPKMAVFPDTATPGQPRQPPEIVPEDSAVQCHTADSAKGSFEGRYQFTAMAELLVKLLSWNEKQNANGSGTPSQDLVQIVFQAKVAICGILEDFLNIQLAQQVSHACLQFDRWFEGRFSGAIATFNDSHVGLRNPSEERTPEVDRVTYRNSIAQLKEYIFAEEAWGSKGPGTPWSQKDLEDLTHQLVGCPLITELLLNNDELDMPSGSTNVLLDLVQLNYPPLTQAAFSLLELYTHKQSRLMAQLQGYVDSVVGVVDAVAAHKFQDLLVQIGVVPLVLRILRLAPPSGRAVPEDLIPVFKTAHGLLSALCSDPCNAKNQEILWEVLPEIMGTVGHPEVDAIGTIMAIMHDNMTLCTKVDETLVRYVLEIQKKHGRQAQVVYLLMTLIMVEGKIIKSNQNLVLQMLWEYDASVALTWNDSKGFARRM
eukprot:gene16498-19589_t